MESGTSRAARDLYEVFNGVANGHGVAETLAQMGDRASTSLKDATGPARRVLLLQVVAGEAAKALSADPSQHLSGPKLDAYVKAVREKLSRIDAIKGDLADESQVLEALKNLRFDVERIDQTLRDSKLEAKEKVGPVMKQMAAFIEHAGQLMKSDLLPCREGSNKLCPANIAARVADVADIYTHVLNKEYPAAVVTSVSLVKALGGESSPWFVKYGGFAAELASAEDSEAAQKAIDNAALPVGSYKLKREPGNFAITLTALPGAQAGGEWLLDSGAAKVKDTRGAQGGFFAPIGLDFSWGLKRVSTGFFVSILDIGALVSYRFKETTFTSDGEEDSVNTTPEVGFAQVVAPGVFWTLGLGKTPVALGAGAAMAPELRSVTAESGGSSELSAAIRLVGFLAVDVSMFSVVP